VKYIIVLCLKMVKIVKMAKTNGKLGPNGVASSLHVGHPKRTKDDTFVV
jgi:hypothetical protein